MGAYWYLACESLSHSATILAEDFQRVNYACTNFKDIIYVSVLNLGIASCWASRNGSRLSCAMASFKQIDP